MSNLSLAIREWWWVRWCFKAAANRNGLEITPMGTHVNLECWRLSSRESLSVCFNQRNSTTSLACSCNPTWRNAFWNKQMAAHLLSLNRINIPDKSFNNKGPRYKQSFKLGAYLLWRAVASNAIRTLVVVCSTRTTEWIGMYCISSGLASVGSFSIICSFSCWRRTAFYFSASFGSARRYVRRDFRGTRLMSKLLGSCGCLLFNGQATWYLPLTNVMEVLNWSSANSSAFCWWLSVIPMGSNLKRVCTESFSIEAKESVGALEVMIVLRV